MLGPSGAGKSSVAVRLAGRSHLSLDSRAIEAALVERIGRSAFADELLTTGALVLDGPVWLQNRPAAVDALSELLAERTRRSLKTFVVQSDDDGSVDLLMAQMPAGSMVVLGLRFPKGKRGRLRFARRVCDQLQIPRLAARGTDALEPWNYERVILYLVSWTPDSDGER